MVDGGPLTGGSDAADDRTFVRVICHEFRTPVASVRALARALARRRTPLSTDQRLEAVRLIVDHAEHLAAMLDAVRTVGEHLPAAEATGRPVTVHLRRLIDGAAHAAGLTGLDVSVSPRAEAVAVDASALRRILTNLLENARRHGGQPVALRAARNGTDLAVAVIDHGPGMPAGVAEAAFDGTPPSHGHGGLGLWIIGRLVAILGGSVRACANQPTGTRVEVTLPVVA